MVGDMHRDDAVGIEVALVNLEGLLGQEVDGDGVAAEGVEHQ